MCCLCKSLCYSLFLIKLFLTYINLLFILCLPVTDENGYFITSTSFNDKLKKKQKKHSIWHVFYFIHSHKLLQRNMLQLLSCCFDWQKTQSCFETAVFTLLIKLLKLNLRQKSDKTTFFKLLLFYF